VSGGQVVRWSGGRVVWWSGGMEKVISFKDLQVWRVSIELVTEIYRLTDNFPKSEIYGLTNQLRRCSVSIPSNIAEGSGRKNTSEFIYFLYISKGSLLELETQLEISKRIGYLKDQDIEVLHPRIKHISSMLVNLIHTLQKTHKRVS
jgi:four helix bundle protein